MTSKKNKIKKYFSRTSGFISPYIFTPPPFAVPQDISPTGPHRALFWRNVTNLIERIDRIQFDSVYLCLFVWSNLVLIFDICKFRNSGF